MKSDPLSYGLSGAVAIALFLLLLPVQIRVFSIFFRLQHQRRRRSDWVGMAASILLILAGALRLAL